MVLMPRPTAICRGPPSLVIATSHRLSNPKKSPKLVFPHAIMGLYFIIRSISAQIWASFESPKSMTFALCFSITPSQTFANASLSQRLYLASTPQLAPQPGIMPMSSNAVVCLLMHLVSSYLNFHNSSSRTKNFSMN